MKTANQPTFVVYEASLGLRSNGPDGQDIFYGILHSLITWAGVVERAHPVGKGNRHLANPGMEAARVKSHVCLA